MYTPSTHAANHKNASLPQNSSAVTYPDAHAAIALLYVTTSGCTPPPFPAAPPPFEFMPSRISRALFHCPAQRKTLMRLLYVTTSASTPRLFEGHDNGGGKNSFENVRTQLMHCAVPQDHTRNPQRFTREVQ